MRIVKQIQEVTFMQTKFTKLNAIRDESADKYADNEENDSIAWAFSAGWDAAMERLKPVIEALGYYRTVDEAWERPGVATKILMEFYKEVE